jgi:hypothetical protein
VVKRILRYIAGTLNFGLCYGRPLVGLGACRAVLRAASGHALKAREARRAVPIWHGESFLRPKHGQWHAGTPSGRADPSTALKISLLVLFFQS